MWSQPKSLGSKISARVSQDAVQSVAFWNFISSCFFPQKELRGNSHPTYTEGPPPGSLFHLPSGCRQGFALQISFLVCVFCSQIPWAQMCVAVRQFRSTLPQAPGQFYLSVHPFLVTALLYALQPYLYVHGSYSLTSMSVVPTALSLRPWFLQPYLYVCGSYSLCFMHIPVKSTHIDLKTLKGS